jgi:hypothetical protein
LKVAGTLKKGNGARKPYLKEIADRVGGIFYQVDIIIIQVLRFSRFSRRARA